MRLTVGVSEMCISKNPGDIIVTHALGSCIGLAIHDPVAHVGGLLHYMLPLFYQRGGFLIQPPASHGRVIPI